MLVYSQMEFRWKVLGASSTGPRYERHECSPVARAQEAENAISLRREVFGQQQGFAKLQLKYIKQRRALIVHVP
jgi:hypothetical protein